MIKFYRKIRQNLLSEGKTGKYMKYAIGEVLLVVLGIIIALQLNNWNDSIKEQQLKDELQNAILSDLKSDLILIDTVLVKVERRVAVFEILQSKLNRPEVTESEVVERIKNDFVAHTTTFPGFKDNSYRSAVSSGSINILQPSVRAIFYELYLLQTDSKQAIDMHESRYFDDIVTFVGSYPLDLPFVAFNQGAVYEKIWSNVDFMNLVNQFNTAATSQRNYYRIMTSVLTDVRAQTMATINELNQNEK